MIRLVGNFFRRVAAMEGEELERVPLRENLPGQGLMLVTSALMGVGVVWAFSTAAGRSAPSEWFRRTDARQSMFAVAGFALIALFWWIDYRWLARRAFVGGRVLKWLFSLAAGLLLVGVGLSVLVLVLGRRIHGSIRWLPLGPINIQPSEVVKLALMVFLAAFLTWMGPRVRRFWMCFVPACLLVGVGCGLIITQDFGTAAIVGTAAFALIFMAGARCWHFLLVLPAAAGAFYRFVYRVPYRWRRIVEAAYQSEQSELAIGTGADPSGIGGGAAKYGYLPEAQSDFIFSVICEEAGIMGAILVVTLLIGWLYLTWRIARQAPDRFGALLAGGLGALVGLQAVLHIAVGVRWAPPTGVPLPFVSYGGTSLITAAAATLLIVSVSARRRNSEDTVTPAEPE